MDSESTKVFDEFIDGVDGYCKQAGLSAGDTDVVWDAVLATTAKQATGEGAPDWERLLRETAYQMPTPAVTAAIGALGSLPVTALVGQRDEWGRKHYLRNAILAAIAGGVSPQAMPKMQDALRQFEIDKLDWNKKRLLNQPVPAV